MGDGQAERSYLKASALKELTLSGGVVGILWAKTNRSRTIVIPEEFKHFKNLLC
jgi:hypothetical protein